MILLSLYYGMERCGIYTIPALRSMLFTVPVAISLAPCLGTGNFFPVIGLNHIS